MVLIFVQINLLVPEPVFFRFDPRHVRTDDLEPFVVHEPHKRSTAVALTTVLITCLVARANHVLRDQAVRVVGLGTAFIVDDRHVHVPQVARRLAVLVQRTPAGRLSQVVHVTVICSKRNGIAQLRRLKVPCFVFCDLQT